PAAPAPAAKPGALDPAAFPALPATPLIVAPPAAPPPKPAEPPQEGGPGGCKNNEECHQYCADPAHVAECNSFARKGGGGGDKMQEALRTASSRVWKCLEDGVDAKTFAKLKRGVVDLSPEDGAVVESCFKESGVADNNKPYKLGDEIPEGYSGPGGCKTMEACIQFCTLPANREVCMASPYIPEQYKGMLQQQGDQGPGEGQGSGGDQQQ
ncbi:MAG TPA: hypothetical protein VNI01_08755, partial [Elusimicrobiota bacterium]|nr:hypothetical protein [Elusimicrobiota bacterium]